MTIDDLRSDADYLDNDDFEEQAKPVPVRQPQFLGMTPVQRFVVALMIFMMVCILGAFFLLITDTIWLPV
jgi:hypothetical protein